jgi:hypothetical protein
MKIKTQYISPISLWLVVRKRFLDTGLFIEPAWVGDSEAQGPVIFTSRILAAVYVHMRNKYHGQDDSNNWRVMPLQAFDLMGHARECGCDSTLWCMMAFGVVFEDANSMVVSLGAPRIRYVPHKFTLSTGNDKVTFSFNQWIFDFIRDEFKSIGLPRYEQQLEALDEMDDVTFERVNICREPTEQEEGEGIWGVYDPDAGVWVSGEEVISTHGEHPGHVIH